MNPDASLACSFMTSFRRAVVRSLGCAVIALVFAAPVARGAAVVSLPTTTVPATGFVVPITLQSADPNPLPLSGFQIELRWDPGLLTYVSVASMPLSGSGAYTVNETGAGILRAIWSTSSADNIYLGAPTPLLSLNFSATSVPSSPTIAFSTPDQYANTLFVVVGAIPQAYSGVTWLDGALQVVPEPINLALGIFFGLAVVTAGARRWVLK